MLLNNKYQVEQVLNSGPTLVQNLFFLQHEGRLDQSYGQGAKFYLPFFLFTHSPQMKSCICFPKTVSFLAEVCGSLLTKGYRSSHKERSYQSCSLLRSHKLTVTF